MSVVRILLISANARCRRYGRSSDLHRDHRSSPPTFRSPSPPRPQILTTDFPLGKETRWHRLSNLKSLMRKNTEYEHHLSQQGDFASTLLKYTAQKEQNDELLGHQYADGVDELGGGGGDNEVYVPDAASGEHEDADDLGGGHNEVDVPDAAGVEHEDVNDLGIDWNFNINNLLAWFLVGTIMLMTRMWVVV